MHKGTEEYRIWLKHRNEKNLKHRSKYKKINSTKKHVRKKRANYLKNSTTYSPQENRYIFSAPRNFSIVNNCDETIEYFNKILNFVADKYNSHKYIHIDISNVKYITSDALMYLLAIINDLKLIYRRKFYFTGNEPKDDIIKKTFIESGFYEYVKYRGNSPLTRNKNNIQIVSGEKCDTALAKKTSDFVCEKCDLTKTQCHFLYNIMIELMSNTHKHAYEGNEFLLPRWYCFARYEPTNQQIIFTFMDTGIGIPSTVQKKLSEKIAILKKHEENSYVISALRGEYRTATKISYRGKGLPTIHNFCKEGKINFLQIISSKASLSINGEQITGKDLLKPIKGTIFKWQININSLKGYLK